jgi:hypothetical protein
MRTSIKNIFRAGVLLLTLQSAWAFVPGGPIGNAGDSWQTKEINYNAVGGELLAPKNIGEEYRRVTPVMFYAADQSFLDFFGYEGLTNIDGAFGYMNQVTNVSSYSADLSEWPLAAEQFNYTAQTLGLTDLRSMTLGIMVEQMGLASPDRYVWTLHDRYLPPRGKCPADELYLIIQRNLDVINTPLNQVQYSSYINSTLYTFNLYENCTGPNPLAYTVSHSVDPFASTYTAIASTFDGLFGSSLNTGGFFAGLTRDDVAGLRYLLSSNNINYEATALSGGVLLVTNVLQPQILSTVPINLLLSQATTNDPGTLQTNYPGLTFISVTTNIVTQVAPTTIAYFTNLFGPYTNSVPFTNVTTIYTNNSIKTTNTYGFSVYPTNGIIPFTNWSPVQYGDQFVLTTRPLAPLLNLSPYLNPTELGLQFPGIVVASVITNDLAVLVTTNIVPYITNQTALPVFSPTPSNGLARANNTNIYYFTNQPGPTVINYDITQNFTTISTLDLGVFSDLSKTNDSATMQALYPGLQILRSTSSAGFVTNITYVSYLTNKVGSPYGSAPILVTKAVATNYPFVTFWHYNFGNVFTNHYYTNRYITVQSISGKSAIGAPFGTTSLTTNTTTYKTNLVSGDFFLIPTNWCGFDLVLSSPLSNPPYTYGATNTYFYSNYISGANSFGLLQNIYDRYTNYNYAVYPGICEPVMVYGTNYTTNIVTTYNYTFANVVTNHYYTNPVVTVSTTNVSYCPAGSPDLLCTNIIVQTFNTNPISGYHTNLASGDFYTVPTNWCGFEIVGLLTNSVVRSDTVTGTNFSGTAVGISSTVTTELTATNYTYAVRLGICEPVVGFGTNYTTNVVTQYSYYFGNIITNSYYTNSPVVVLTTNIAIVTNGLAVTLTNLITTNITYNGISGDFFIPPANWCNYSILRTQLQSTVYFTNTLTATNLPGVADVGQFYQQLTITQYTNSILIVQPSLCSQATPPPALRQGIEHIQFVRANYDSLLGQFFQPITNNYTMVMITNSQMVAEYYQRVVARPDFTLSAQDLATPQPGITGIGEFDFTRNIRFDQSQILTGLAGPGTIIPSTTITYNKAGTVYENGSRSFYGLATNVFLYPLNETNQFPLTQWASFDGSTNDPILYPNGTSIQNLVNQLYIQVSPQSLTDGTNGVPYSQSFTATGGQMPYTWAAPNFSTLVPGMTFDPTTATMSGTPLSAGVFNFTLQLTDAANRLVNLNYSITIH